MKKTRKGFVATVVGVIVALLMSVILISEIVKFAGKSYVPPSPVPTATGKVVDVQGTLPLLMKSSGAMFGNESIKIGKLTLVLTVSTSDGEYTIDVDDRPYGPQTINNLAVALKIGSTVKFPLSRRYPGSGSESGLFSSGKLGIVSSNEIEITPDPATRLILRPEKPEPSTERLPG